MKKLLVLLLVSLFSLSTIAVADEEVATAPVAKFKQVCKDVKDKKGKVSQQCKKVRVHKKFEGTAIPVKAPVVKPAAPAKKVVKKVIKKKK